jgi:hypothetical protein
VYVCMCVCVYVCMCVHICRTIVSTGWDKSVGVWDALSFGRRV